jgi:hemerythrin-like metal-binding protein
MTFMSWRNDYEVGIAQIDQEHRYLFGLINECFDGHARGGTAKSLQEILSRLVAYAEVHFQNEERLMQDSAFPGWQAHHALHEKLFDSIFNLNEKRAAGNARADTDTLNFLKRWLLDHILKEDMVFADFLHRKAAQKRKTDVPASPAAPATEPET